MKAWIASLGGALALATMPMTGFAQGMVARYDAQAQLAGDLPRVLDPGERQHFARLFDAIDANDWGTVEALSIAYRDHPLTRIALAEYYLDADSPRVELPKIENWLSTGSRLPQAEQLVALGEKRGLTYAPPLPSENRFVRQAYAPKRIRPRTIDDGTMPATIRDAILERIKNDDPDGARLLLDGVDATLSPRARAEWRQRVAWSYYIENDDPASLAMAQRVAQDGSGPWVAEGEWVAGLAAWRMGDCAFAADAFERAAMLAANAELISAARYWAARAWHRCRSPEKIAEQLRAAAVLDETLYGMLAREQLGQAFQGDGTGVRFSAEDWRTLADEPNVRAAIGLAEIGQGGLADEALRHQARTGNPADYGALSRLARALGLPGTQLWMAHNAPAGAEAERALRYPVAAWQPVSGWQVDPALAYAHALQESNFRAAVVSPAGARGLMQIMPAAAQDHAGALGLSGGARSLNRPEVNLAFGQRHLQMLNSAGATGGTLPKIMAAYNAGLRPVGRWNSEVRDQGDPLLWMESIPYWETRGYVAIVMRNYWMYQRQAGQDSPAREALAENQWPRFPGPPQMAAR